MISLIAYCAKPDLKLNGTRPSRLRAKYRLTTTDVSFTTTPNTYGFGNSRVCCKQTSQYRGKSHEPHWVSEVVGPLQSRLRLLSYFSSNGNEHPEALNRSVPIPLSGRVIATDSLHVAPWSLSTHANCGEAKGGIGTGSGWDPSRDSPHR